MLLCFDKLVGSGKRRMDPSVEGLEFSLALSEAVKRMDCNPLKPKQVESI